MKNAIFFLIFLISFCGIAQDISGSWSWQAETGETLMEISLKAEGSDYTGHHCTVFQNGGRIDCIDVTEPASIRIKRTAENVFEGTIRSGYSASEGKIKLLFNPEEKTLLFEIMEGPVDIYYLPKKAILKENPVRQSESIYGVIETVLDEYQVLDFVLCSKPLDYDVNSITTQGKPLIDALDLNLIANFQEWTPTGGAVPIKDILNKKDLEYMKSQIKSGFEWDREKISIKMENCLHHHFDIELKFSKPLFNKEKNLSLVFLEQSSIADYSMSLILLRKEDGNWRRLWSLAM